MTCILSFNKHKYGQKFTRSISDVFSVSMEPKSNKLIIQIDKDGVLTKEVYEVNDTLEIKLTAEDLM